LFQTSKWLSHILRQHELLKKITVLGCSDRFQVFEASLQQRILQKKLKVRLLLLQHSSISLPTQHADFKNSVNKIETHTAR